jgi:hypothetical protein
MAEYTRKDERTFSVGDAPLLKIANRRGVLTERGVDRSDISFASELRVDADSRDDAEERAKTVELPMEQHDDTVEIGPPEFTETKKIRIFGFTPQWRGPRIDMVVEVLATAGCRRISAPAVSASRASTPTLRVGTCTGRVRVAEIEGELEIAERTGAVEVHSVTGGVCVETRTRRVEVEDVTGEATLSSRTGVVQAQDISDALSCRTRTGAIRVVNCGGTFNLETMTGVVEYRGDIAANGSIEVCTGRITLAVQRGA